LQDRCAGLCFAGKGSRRQIVVGSLSEKRNRQDSNVIALRVAQRCMCTFGMFEPRRKEQIMSRFKLAFAAMTLTAIASVAPLAHAAPVLKVMMVGASGSWQAIAVGAYNSGACPDAQTPGNCKHYSSPSSGGNFTLTDSRPTLGGLGG